MNYIALIIFLFYSNVNKTLLLENNLKILYSKNYNLIVKRNFFNCFLI
jgi:hypothetical protein